MKRYFKYAIIALCSLLAMPVFTACDNDDFDTNQYVGGVHLNTYGPCPVARGGQLRFLGSGMSQITKITLPGSGDITDIEVINDGEIRITVPQDAMPGKVVLHYAGGTIETKTLLSFSEPISIDDIAPLRVKPGQTLTITGDYLNLIKEVCFSFPEGADSVNVFADDFITHERKTIAMAVPEEAISGPVMISDAREMPNTIVSELAIEVVIPTVDNPVDLKDCRGGDKVTVTGRDLDLVRKVLMPVTEDEVEFVYTPAEGEAAESIGFVLPEDITNGTVLGVTASGVRVALANAGVVVPTELTATPATGIRGGDLITIKGVNLDQVASVGFLVGGAYDFVKPESQTASQIEVKFPALGQGGEVQLALKSNMYVPLVLETAKPEMLGATPSPVPAAGEVTITGKNLDLTTTILFKSNDGTVEATPESATADEIKVKVPATAITGPLTFNMANGESAVSAVSLEVAEAVCAIIVSMDTEEPAAGEIMTFTIANADKLTGVEVNGQAVQYICNGDKLYVNLPSNCGKGTVVRLISSNGEFSATYDVTPATHVENVIYDGPMFDLGNWDAGGLRLPRELFVGVPAGAEMIFSLSAPDGGQIQINDVNWSQIGDIFDVPAGASSYTVTLTQQMLDAAINLEDQWGQTGLVLNGQKAVISKIAIAYERSMETTIWTGSFTVGDWDGGYDALSWDKYDWSTVKAGTVLRLYCTPTVADGEWWCVSMRHGQDWGALPDPCPGQIDTPAGGVAALELTQAILDDMVANGGLIVTGAFFTLTKVTLE